jgi:hypothetical protein
VNLTGEAGLPGLVGMAFIRWFLLFGAIISICAGTLSVNAQDFTPFPVATFPALLPAPPRDTPRYSQELGVKKFINSFTSYQFPNPFPPQQDPLSRLEFPIDQWFLGLKGQYRGSWWSLIGEGWINVSRDSAFKMQDSDWDDENNPSQKTIFSESQCRLNRGILLDIATALGNPVPRFLNLRPLVGLRYQYFFFTTHDGYQTALGGFPTDLPGDGIEFKQWYYQIYFGGNFHTFLNLGIPGSPLGRPRLDLQFDYALVRGKNEDLHLLREGRRVTEQITNGHCWHLYTGLSFVSSNRLRARIEVDLKRVLTHGGHLLTNSLFDVNFSFDGSRVWSDQLSISGVFELAM